MKRIITILSAVILSMTFLTAQDYPQVVTYESFDGVAAVFTSVGAAEKSKEVQNNAVESLLYTLFYVGVDGINDGKPLVTNDNPGYVQSFFKSRVPFFVRSVTEISAPAKNALKVFQGSYRIEVVYSNLLKDLERNKLREAPMPVNAYAEVENEQGMVLPTIIVVPYRRDGETFDAILASDFDRRMAVGKLQEAFESRNVTTVDMHAKLAATKRNAQFGMNDADSNDKQLLMNSGADVYVEVDLNKDVNAEGARVSLLMKAYETASGSVLASKDAITRRVRNASTDVLCSYAVSDNVDQFLDVICKNLSKQTVGGKRVVLQFAIDGASSASMSDRCGPQNYPLSNLIHQWVRKNSYNGKYHLQGIVDTSVLFDYVMIPPKDADGYAMDAAQFGFMIEAWLNDEIGVPCTSRFDGTTIYVTIL